MVISTKKKEFLNVSKQKFYSEIKKYQRELKPTKEIEGFAAFSIVGEKNYPYLSTHSISNEQTKANYRESSTIVKQDYDDIFSIKAKNILGSTQANYVKHTNTKIQEELRDIYKAKNTVNFASNFDKELTFDKVIVNKVAGIVGSKNDLLSLEATENTATSKQIEKHTQEDIKAREAIITLYERGYNEHQIINLLALGSFGFEINKKLVPTKWAISAYDQTIEKYLHKKLLQFNEINNYEIYSHNDKGNHFVVILLPDNFNGNVIESWRDQNGLVVEEDYVGVDNKLHKEAPETAGGFYATKLAVHEHLMDRKKQASYLSIRFIKGYDIPLGVVFVRECVREALSKKPLIISSNKGDIEKFLFENYKEHFGLYMKSTYLKERSRQKKLRDFF